MDPKILHHFKDADGVLFGVIEYIKEPITPRKSANYFQSLCDEIISQQLSGKVADVIFQRFKKLFPDEIIEPLFLLAIPTEHLREIGMSGSKAGYVKNIAKSVIEQSLILENLENMRDEEVIKELVKVKGIGRWTAEMFLMFSLGREDVFSFGDLGLRKGIQKLYKLKNEPTLKLMQDLTRKWSPYRTYASLILWKSLAL